ncbi:HNH endonuclease [Nocardia nova]|uniref:HNH endonuclease n=1 Tax=Nocardia nova TaxID=37330 RepID=UPI00189439B1|nr:HNH endonuclease [Nocardia nova]MBF6149365.1 HNH endonuclease [Nocardia nova]
MESETSAVQVSKLERQYVLEAIDEFDRLGRVEFLATHGFRAAREYFLLYSGVAYDSKPIVGVAYDLMTGETHGPSDFSGGQALAIRLQQLGFEVTGSLDWKPEEQILACDLLVANGWATIPERDERVAKLSARLRAQWVYSSSVPEYRSNNAVHQKLEDLRTNRPGYPGVPKRGGKLTPQIAAAFNSEPEKMRALAAQLWAEGDLSLPTDFESDISDDAPLPESPSAAELVSAVEGRSLHRQVRVYERDPKLRDAKLKWSRRNRGSIACEVCQFDFEKFYPGHGSGYAEVHHINPLHITQRVENTIDDLIVLCANCHRMIHRGGRALTPDELRGILATA